MRILWIIMMGLSFTASAQKELTWNIFHPVKNQWIELGEKGSVQEALIATGELPDPFVGMNEDKFAWIEDYQWEFKSIFVLSEKEFASDFIELEFPSLDTYAAVFLNDSLIFTGQNAFIPHTVRLRNHLKLGVNELTIIFTPPVLYHKEIYETASYHLPAPNDKHDIAIAPYTRKPQYQFGWDWALRMNTVGLNKPAKINFSKHGSVVSKTTRVISVDKNKAVLEFEITLSNPEIETLEWDSKLFGKATVKRKKNRFVRREEIENPQLWWPKGHGDQYLYDDKIVLSEIKGNQLVNVIDLKFGVKTSELVQEKDEWGTSYYFKINGRTIFCKGGDYIPQDIFPARVKDEDIEKMVETMAASNFNMVRVWGGGYYPDEVFFNKCDELGIMVWQDFMFACAMYPGDDDFVCNITKEFYYQVPRIAAHPSVVLFNGNNEVEVAWGNWGFQIKYGLYGKSAKEIERSYDRVFKEVAPSVVEEFSTIPYIHTSPLSNWGKDEFYNHGSQHYWGVWHGKDPLEDFGKKIGRFNAEYGFQSFPEYSTLLTFSDTSEWNVGSEVMKHHQKSYVGNDMILKHAKRLYGKPESFEDMVYYSQLTQAKAVSMAVAGHRVDAPRCRGTLYWQINDCWPAPTWSSIDYNWNWKALQYEIQKDYLDVAVVAKYHDLIQRDFYVVNDLNQDFNCVINVSIKDFSGVELHQFVTEHAFKGAGDFLIDFSDEQIVQALSQNCVIHFKWNDANGNSLERTYTHKIVEYEKATADDLRLTIEAVNPKANTAVLKISTTKFVDNLWISSSKFGVKFEQNFFQLLPGEVLIPITYSELPVVGDFKLKWM